MEKRHLAIMQLAIAEIKKPTFGTIERVLNVHEVANLDDSKNVYIDDSETPGNYKVYFKLRKEPYCLVVMIDVKDDQILVSGSYIEGYARVYVCVYSDDLSPDEISRRVGLRPTKIIVKDTAIAEKVSKKAAENQWFYEPQRDLPYSVERKLDYLLAQLMPFSKNIAALPPGTSPCIHICYKGYKDWMGGWHFDVNRIQQISEINAEVDFDLYASGPDFL